MWIRKWLCSPRREHRSGCWCGVIGHKLAGVALDTMVVDGGMRSVVEGIKEKGPMIIYCHGTKRNLCSCTHMLDLLKSTVVLFDYRGFGLSPDGDYSLASMREDVLSVVDAVSQSYPQRKIYLYGHSLGGLVVAGIRDQRISGRILEGAPYALPNWLPCGLSWLLGLDADQTWSRIPTLLLHSLDDELVPFDHVLRYHRLLTEAKLHPLTGCHRLPDYDEEYVRIVHEFISWLN